jgi:hypothetical protein
MSATEAQVALDELKAARAEMDRYRLYVETEMRERARDFELWTNNRCEAWPDYQKSLEKLKQHARSMEFDF